MEKVIEPDRKSKKEPLIEIDTKELVFTYENQIVTPIEIKLRNISPNWVLFKVKTSARNFYNVSPSQYHIASKGIVSVTIKAKSQHIEAIPKDYAHKFLIECAMSDKLPANANAVWDNPLTEVVKEKIPARFVKKLEPGKKETPASSYISPDRIRAKDSQDAKAENSASPLVVPGEQKDALISEMCPKPEAASNYFQIDSYEDYKRKYDLLTIENAKLQRECENLHYDLNNQDLCQKPKWKKIRSILSSLSLKNGFQKIHLFILAIAAFYIGTQILKFFQ
eukprot:TRINITY_DN3391_c0_g1_i1.p1 TRINITY_DN3391_c0_g1~~TRINITY_DN3391_c0_g1_i1.p1  ORF type:complete len:280 (+),score=52.69 TRINITY_DN3391_c0_g1_i1:32-871(+)